MRSFFRHAQSPLYHRLGDGESEKESGEDANTFTEQTSHERKYHAKFLAVLSISNIVTAFISCLFWRRVFTPTFGSFSTGYATDFGPARSHIEVELVRFTGGPSFLPNGSMYIPHPTEKKYVGDPEPEIDQNWEELTWGRYILATEEEMKAQWPDEWDQFWEEARGGYVVGFDMFHTLHCLVYYLLHKLNIEMNPLIGIQNRLRRDYYPDYYAIKNTTNHWLHRDHCIEQIRQYIMCSGDMTPIPTRYYPSKDRNYVDSDYPHTCRNYEKLHNWATERYNGSSAIQPHFREEHEE
ncbi:hypothetical protein NA57DRAFT_75250 [Rhizodiscina lignyota]|uniref:Cyclochlorotine biosynthesis protein O n=1 Tax=Rhizodiscina lignyota TaxID=1504668 RepID=A0A9P4M793_9PEZI|nr:hypothetical protein NA57DRAFT_75250 [Rhizodiscina lignyota]